MDTAGAGGGETIERVALSYTHDGKWSRERRGGRPPCHTGSSAWRPDHPEGRDGAGRERRFKTEGAPIKNEFKKTVWVMDSFFGLYQWFSDFFFFLAVGKVLLYKNR